MCWWDTVPCTCTPSSCAPNAACSASTSRASWSMRLLIALGWPVLPEVNTHSSQARSSSTCSSPSTPTVGQPALGSRRKHRRQNRSPVAAAPAAWPAGCRQPGTPACRHARRRTAQQRRPPHHRSTGPSHGHRQQQRPHARPAPAGGSGHGRSPRHRTRRCCAAAAGPPAAGPGQSTQPCACAALTRRRTSHSPANNTPIITYANNPL